MGFSDGGSIHPGLKIAAADFHGLVPLCLTSVKSSLAGQHLVQHGAGRKKDVAAGISGLPAHWFWRHIANRSQHMPKICLHVVAGSRPIHA
jgi:hypothetical protein